MLAFAKGERINSAVLQAQNVELRGPDETSLVDELRNTAVAQGIAAAIDKLKSFAKPGSGHYVTTTVITLVFQAIASQDKAAAE